MVFQLTWAIIILAIGGILGITAIAKKMDKKNRQMLGWIGGIGVAIGIIALIGIIPQLDTLNNPIDFGGGDTLAVGDSITGITTGAAQTTCPPGSVEDVTVTLSAIDKFSSVATGGTHTFRVNGGAAETVSDAGTFSASGGDKVTTLWVNATTSGQNYFADLSEIILACDKGTQRITKELVQNGTMTIDVFNRDTDKMNGGVANQTMGAGDVFTLDFRLTSTFQKGFPWGGIIVSEFNSTILDDVIVQVGGSKTSVPNFYTVLHADNKAQAYTVPAMISNQEIDGSIVLDADDSINPLNESITFKFYPNNYFIDGDNAGAFSGPAVEDEDDQQTYLHVTTATINID